MKTTSLMNALKKNGFNITTSEEFKTKLFCEGINYVAHWYKREHESGEIQLVYMHKKGDKDDILSDYHCGWFPETIKEIIRYLGK